jgi:hypothetical protein
MADKAPSQTERIRRILDGVAEHIQSAPGEELVEDARTQGENPEAVAAHVKSVLLTAITSYRQRELKAARESYEQAVVSMKARRVELPKRPDSRRRWLAAVFNQQPQLQAAFTMQNRDFSDLTDEDVEAHLRKLDALGVLKDVSLPDDNG